MKWGYESGRYFIPGEGTEEKGLNKLQGSKHRFIKGSGVSSKIFTRVGVFFL